jgi:hypothetical protein
MRSLSALSPSYSLSPFLALLISRSLSTHTREPSYTHTHTHRPVHACSCSPYVSLWSPSVSLLISLSLHTHTHTPPCSRALSPKFDTAVLSQVRCDVQWGVSIRVDLVSARQRFRGSGPSPGSLRCTGTDLYRRYGFRVP